MSDTKALYSLVADALAGQGREVQDAHAELLRRLERAEADNAALLKALHSAYRPHAGECIRWSGATGQQVRPCPCGLDALLDAEHPGAALLEELEAHKTAIATLEKAVSVAHDAALEKAAKKMRDLAADASKRKHQHDANGDGAARDAWFHCQTTYERAQQEISALKKTGQGNG